MLVLKSRGFDKTSVRRLTLVIFTNCGRRIDDSGNSALSIDSLANKYNDRFDHCGKEENFEGIKMWYCQMPIIYSAEKVV